MRTSPGSARRSPFLFSLPILLLAVTFGASASEDSAEAPDTIVITAPAPQDSESPAVRVIEVDQAIEAGHTTVADAVRGTPGIDIQQRGSGFESSTVRIRGSSAEQVVVLRDGRRVDGGTTGVVDLSTLSLRGVERIEVVLGAATALYGTGGAAGAINLISRAPDNNADGDEGFTGTSIFEYGSLGEYRLGGEVTVPVGAGVLDATVEGAYAENEYSYDRNGSSEARENAGGWQGKARLGVERRGELATVRLFGALHRSDRGIPGTVEFPSDSARLEENGAGLELSVGTRGAVNVGKAAARSSSASSWGTVYNLTARRTERSYADPEYPLGALSSRSTLYRLNAQGIPRGPLGGGDLLLPVSYTFEALRESELGERERHIAAFAPGYSTSRIPLGSSTFRWLINGRVEVVTVAAEAQLLPSVRTSVEWRSPTELLETTVAVGAGYRLPTYSELFRPAAAFALGNPELKPEESRSAELQLSLGREESHEIQLSAHLTSYRNLIQWLPNPTGFWRPENGGRAITYGGELAYRIARPIGLSPWSGDADSGVALLYARDLSPGPTYNKQLPYRPAVSATLTGGLSHLLGHRIGATLRTVGERPVTPQNTVFLDPYVAIDLNGAFAVPRTPVTLRGRVNNLLDQEFVESRFFPNPGRELVISMEVAW